MYFQKVDSRTAKTRLLYFNQTQQKKTFNSRVLRALPGTEVLLRADRHELTAGGQQDVCFKNTVQNGWGSWPVCERRRTAERPDLSWPVHYVFAGSKRAGFPHSFVSFIIYLLSYFCVVLVFLESTIPLFLDDTSPWGIGVTNSTFKVDSTILGWWRRLMLCSVIAFTLR